MIVNLIKSKQMFSLTLPSKTTGQYWLTDTDDRGRARRLVAVEAIDGVWMVKSNRTVSVMNGSARLGSCALDESSYLLLSIDGEAEKAILFTEPVDATHQTLTKIGVREAAVFSIGRTDDNHFRYDDEFVTGHHAQLLYDGAEWSIQDMGSLNGTYVNGNRIQSTKLFAGDFIYIMGLKIVIGGDFIAVNNPGGKLKIKSDSLEVYAGQEREGVRTLSDEDIPEKQFFVRSPRFRREIQRETITIEAPPPLQKLDTVPLALMLGPSITMGMTSLSTGVLAVTNTLANGGKIMQALPSLVMSLGMLLGTILWPILTKKYEKKEKIKAEKIRQEKYLNYLKEVGDLIREKSREQSEILSENLSGQDECADRIIRQKSSLWERVIGQSDFLRLRLGTGNVPLDAEIKYPEKKFTMEDDFLQNAMLSLAEEPKQLTAVPISLSLVENAAVGLYGEKAATNNMLKALLLQMVALHSYDELKLMLITEEQDAEEWEFAKYIPHFWDNEKTTRFFATTSDEVKELSAYLEQELSPRIGNNRGSYADYAPYYVLISTSAKMEKYCEALPSLLKLSENVGFTFLSAHERFDSFPKETKTLVRVGRDHSEIMDKDNTSGQPIPFIAEYTNEAAFDRLAAKLASVELDVTSHRYTLPTMMTFLEMFGVGRVEHLNALSRWKDNNPTKTLQTPVGVDEDGELFKLDLHEKFHGPHGLVAGMTGSGKSEFLITYILSLAVNYHPDEVAFILIDYKGGGLADAFADAKHNIKLPHLAGTITNLDGASIKRSLTSIQSELRRRQALFKEAKTQTGEGTMDIYKYQQLYRDKAVTEPLPHLFIISDEFAELKMQQPEFMQQLISAARIGRSLGVHLILATQKPSGVVDDQIWSNSKFRVCLKVQDKSDSQDMIKCPDAAAISQTGRFFLQVGFNEFFALGQSAWCGADYIPVDTVERTRDAGICVIDNLGHAVMNVKPQVSTPLREKSTEQIVAVVRYLSDMADGEGIAVRHLWLDPIPAEIFVDALYEKYGVSEPKFRLNPVIGEYDDPFNQRQEVLTIPFSDEGNCLVYGAAGNGKTTFLTSLCYALIRHHSPEEVNLYLMDFGSETLRAFEKAPQVGAVITSSEEEKTINLFKMLKKEMERRKALFAEYGGDYASYCNAGKTDVPNVVVMVNNYSGFAEQYEDLLEEFAILTRDGSKYGLYFVVTASSTNAVRYKIQQNFKMMLTMQLNDATDYALVVGRTDGLIPAKHKGRGLIALDKPYEFQTALCADQPDVLAFLREYCASLAATVETRAKAVPVLPERVNADFVRGSIGSLKAVPVGVAKGSLDVATVNLMNRVMYPVIAQDAEECGSFAEELTAVLSEIVKPVLCDAEDLIQNAPAFDPEETVRQMFEEMVLRNNTYKDADLDVASLEPFEEKVYIIVGFKKFVDRLSADGKDKLNALLEKAEAIYKLHFVVCEAATRLNAYNYEGWYKRHLSGGDGLWLGEGVADQYVLKISKLTSDLYAELAPEYGYVITKGRPVLTKLLAGGEI